MQFPLDFVRRVWDMFICNGWNALYCVGLALLHQMSNFIFSMRSMDQVMSLILGSFEYDWRGIDPEAVLTEASKLNIDSIVLKYKKRYAETVNTNERQA
jgi:hypothetical protein